MTSGTDGDDVQRVADPSKPHQKSWSCTIYSRNWYTGAGVPYICLSMAESMLSAGLPSRVFVPGGKPEYSRISYVRPWSTDNPPAFVGRLPNHLHKVRYALTVARPGRFAYLWPDAPIPLIRLLKRLGVPIIREMLNTHVAYAKVILDSAFHKHGLPACPITEEHVAFERESLRLADGIVAPSQDVITSLLENGVPAAKIIPSSYGWDSSRIGAAGAAPWDGPFTVLFVGSIGIRKGADTLIHAWRKAEVDGRLVLLGKIEDEAEALIRPLLGGNVEHVPFSADVSSFYSKADVFSLPSLEEGDPLVSHEAAGAGLPLIATSMGGGRSLCPGENGILVRPGSIDDLAAAIRTLADDADMRRAYGSASAERAKAYTWRVVGAQRARAFESFLDELPSSDR